MVGSHQPSAIIGLTEAFVGSVKKALDLIIMYGLNQLSHQPKESLPSCIIIFLLSITVKIQNKSMWSLDDFTRTDLSGFQGFRYHV